MPGDNLKLADQFASAYDLSVLKQNWNGPELIFHHTKDLLKSRSSILDLGIGTGESSIRFYKDAHYITGLDGSVKMLELCSKKLVAARLFKHDLELIPYPLKDKTFDVVLSNGVFHLIHPLKPLFREVARLLKPKGIFVFTFDNDLELEPEGYRKVEAGIYKRISEAGVVTFKYSSETINNYLECNSFKILDSRRFLAHTHPETGANTYFILSLTQLLRNQSG